LLCRQPLRFCRPTFQGVVALWIWNSIEAWGFVLPATLRLHRPTFQGVVALWVWNSIEAWGFVVPATTAFLPAYFSGRSSVVGLE